MSTHTTFIGRMTSLLTDNRSDRWVSRRKTGTLDFKRLSRVAHSDRLFKKKLERKGKSYNVSILVDCSPSMCGGSIALAIDAMRKMSDALGAVGVSFEVAGFSTWDYILRDFSNKRPTKQELDTLENDLYCLTEDMRGDTSKCNLPLRIFYVKEPHRWKAWEKNNPDAPYSTQGWDTAYIAKDYADLKARYGVDRSNVRAHDHVSSGTSLGKNVHEAVNRLKKQKEGKNIFLLLSDGGPSDTGAYCGDRKDNKTYHDFDFKKEVERGKRHDITMLAIGIYDKTMSKFYPKENHEIISDPSQLYKAMVKLLSRNIRRGE